MKLTKERPGARFRRGSVAIELQDHGTELHNGRIRRWVDYQELNEHYQANGALKRATEDDPLDDWILLHPGFGADYQIEHDETTADLSLRPKTGLGRAWCRNELGSEIGGTLPKNAEEIPGILAKARDAGLKPDQNDILSPFLTDSAATSPVAQSAIDRLVNTVQILRMPDSCELCNHRTPEKIAEDLAIFSREIEEAVRAKSSENLAVSMSRLMTALVFMTVATASDQGQTLCEIIDQATRSLTKQHRKMFGASNNPDH